MITSTAQSRLASFFSEISGLASFMNCDHVDVHTRGFQGETPLKIAVLRQDLQLVRDLLDAGADPNLPGEDDYTPLHHAAGAESAEICRLLLEHGASASLVDIYGHRPIDYATKQNLELFKRRD